MKTKKQNPDFLHIGLKILDWYQINGRDLPFRKTKDAYKIWISEIVFQQTRINQGLGHYHRFITRFPDVKTLASASLDEVLLYWKGLGYYSRAINIHKASQQITQDFNGVFPATYKDIIQLKGIGKYTAAAISSISFGEKIPAVDGNFFRVLSRIFADDFQVSSSKAFDYFSQLAYLIMPNENAGDFNQAIMDLGSEICKPKNPNCEICPIHKDCLAYNLGKTQDFPVKKKKNKPTDLFLQYYFVEYQQQFLVQQRNSDFIWKKLYEFPTEIKEEYKKRITSSQTITHKLTHKNMTIQIDVLQLIETEFYALAKENNLQIIDLDSFHEKSFPKPLENYVSKFVFLQNV